MAEKKPGLLKRIFSFGFGKKKAEEPEEVAAVEDNSAAVEAERAEADRIEAERLAREQAEAAAAEAEILRQQEEEKAAAEAERIEAEARAKAEELAKAEEEAERQTQEAKDEAARKKREADEEKVKAEQERAEELARKQAEAAEAIEETMRQAELAKAEEEREKQDRLDAAAAKKAEQEDAEAKRAAKEAAEAKAEAERIAKEQAEAERLAKEAEEAAQKEQAEAERLAQEEAAKAEKAEQEKLAEEAEKAEQERLAEEEAKKAEAERTAELARAPEPEPEPEPEEEEKREGWFKRLRKGLSRSSNALTENIAAVFTKRKLDEDTLQELEDILIQADLGIETAMTVTDALSAQRYGKDVTDEEVREIMAEEIGKVLEPVAQPLELDLEHQPHVILVVGVNGSGKTTTIGKLSQKLYDAGFSTLLVAGDTFRAAAIEQLKIWGDRTQSPVVSRELGSDAAGLAFDAYTQAREEGRDVMLMDTAGRLQNKKELMDELEKIVRVLKKQDPDAPHTVLLTLDATTGQNAMNQVEIFKNVAGVNGLVMTKLDGTARGGILVSISAKHKLPVYFIGVGEQVADLEPFEADQFAKSIAGIE